MILSKKSKLEIKLVLDGNLRDYLILDILLHPVQSGAVTQFTSNTENSSYQLQCFIVAREAADISWQCCLACYPAMLDMTCTAVFTAYIL